MRATDWDRKWELRIDERMDPKVPSRFLVEQVERLPPGRALDLACGAGRNAVWLAARGWRVTGVDFSEVGLRTARRLAEEQGVAVDWVLADVLDYEPEPAAYDLVLVLYLQVPAEERRRVLGRAASAAAAGGRVLVVGHDASNLTDGYGGPKDPRVLFSAGEVAAELPGLTVERAERVERPVPADGGERVALDALVLARRPDARGR